MNTPYFPCRQSTCIIAAHVKEGALALRNAMWTVSRTCFIGNILSPEVFTNRLFTQTGHASRASNSIGTKNRERIVNRRSFLPFLALYITMRAPRKKKEKKRSKHIYPVYTILPRVAKSPPLYVSFFDLLARPLTKASDSVSSSLAQ